MLNNRNNLLINWYNDIDRFSLPIVLGIILFGLLMSYTASPIIAERIEVDHYFFLKRHFIYALIAIVTIFIISNFTVNLLKISSLLGLFISIILLIAVLLFGDSVKGATRWINIAGKISIQPSEFAKIFFLVTNALILSHIKYYDDGKKIMITSAVLLPIIFLIILQPDFGMSFTIILLYAIQLFIADIAIFYFLFLGVLAILGILFAYILIPHVSKRINSFFLTDETSQAGNYQVNKAIEAIENGGIFGRGFGGGLVKNSLPDCHTDFIFAVIVEEFGALLSLIMVAMIGFFLMRILIKRRVEQDQFTLISIVGLVMMFVFQYLFNIGVCLHLLPTKGTTLPFISYGGSSMLASAVAIGIILCLTKKRYGSMVDAKSLVID